MKKILLAAGLWACGAGAQAAPADDIKHLLEAAQDAQAYQLGRSLPDQLGQPLFDFYYGIAAINAGAPGEGVLALERYLLHFPQNASARFHLARGYFTLVDDARAKEEFEALAKVAQGGELYAINRFLDAIRSREANAKPSVTTWAELGAGRDNNINSGVLSGQIAGLPDGLVVAPGQTSEQRADNVGTIQLGVQGSLPLRPSLSLYGGLVGNVRRHVNRSNDVFDQDAVTAFGGVSRTLGRHALRAGVDVSSIYVFRQQYLRALSLSGEWNYQLDQFNRFGAQAQWSRQSYQNISTYLEVQKTTPVDSGGAVRDSDLINLGAHWRRSFLTAWSPVATLNVNAGQEKNTQDRPDLSRNFWGARLGVTAQPANAWTLGAGLGYMQSRFGGPFSEGLEPRRDTGTVLDLNAGYTVTRNWSVRLEYQHLDQRSNIGLYQLNRDALALKLRYDSL
jgi:opacity protein-like surface antigen